MPKDKSEKMALTVWIDKELVERIDRLSEKGGIPRNKLLTNLIEVNIEELEIMNKIGVWAISRIYEDIKQRLRGKDKKKKADKIKQS